jgi:hypothetical protein
MWSTPGVTRSPVLFLINLKLLSIWIALPMRASPLDFSKLERPVAAVRCVTPHCRLGPLAPSFKFKFANAQPPEKTTRKLIGPVATRVIAHRPTSKKRKEVLRKCSSRAYYAKDLEKLGLAAMLRLKETRPRTYFKHIATMHDRNQPDSYGHKRSPTGSVDTDPAGMSGVVVRWK